ncbi:MAG: hypoxanthine phosphoribosyltransferase [Flavicella sp.]
MLKVGDKNFEPYIDKSQIQKAVLKVALAIENDLGDETPLFIGVLNGSFMFCADFMKVFNAACEISFVKLASYEKSASTGKVTSLLGLNENLKGRTVVVLEDIIDTGNTLEKIYEILEKEDIKTLKIATLFFKPTVFDKKLKIDYIGMEIPDEFILGYGLDYDGLGRNLSDIYKLSN